MRAQAKRGWAGAAATGVNTPIAQGNAKPSIAAKRGKAETERGTFRRDRGTFRPERGTFGSERGSLKTHRGTSPDERGSSPSDRGTLGGWGDLALRGNAGKAQQGLNS